jgi:hypothetical protein
MIHGFIKDLGITVPLRRKLRFQDPRTGKVFDGWEIAIDVMDAALWPKLLADMRGRLPDCPKDDADFRRQITEQGGLPIRAERVIVTYDLRGFI